MTEGRQAGVGFLGASLREGLRNTDLLFYRLFCQAVEIKRVRHPEAT